MNLRPNLPEAPTIQVTISNKLLPTGKLYRTFKTTPIRSAFDQAHDWGDPIEAALEKGLVPADVIQPETVRTRHIDAASTPTFLQMLNDYEAQPHVKISDSFKEIAGNLMSEIAKVRFHEMTMEWVDERLDYYKNEKAYASSTTKKRIETLSVIHAFARSKLTGGQKLETICEQLPLNYHKRADDAAEKTKLDQIGERPVTKDREAAIRAVFSGEKEIAAISIPTLRDPQLETLYTLISNTGMRLQEAYLLRVDNLNFKQFIINVGGSKGWYGVNKPRTTFMRKVVREALQAHIERNNLQADDFLFKAGWWDGDCASPDKKERKKARKKTSAYLSGLFRSLYYAAGVEGITEHDLRHEATIRYVEMEQDGKPIYNREDLKKMLGWTSDKMVSHYLTKWRPEIGASRVSADL